MDTRPEVAKEQIVGYVTRDAVGTCGGIVIFAFFTIWIGHYWRTIGLTLMWLDIAAAGIQALKLLVGAGTDVALWLMGKFWPREVAAARNRNGDESAELRSALLIRIVELAFFVGTIYYVWRFFYPNPK